MIDIVLASVFLPLSHFVLSSAAVRAPLVRRLGEGRFSLLYSLIAIAAFAWLVVAYWRAPTFVIWVAPVWVRAALLPVILAASLLVVAGLTTPNPVIVQSSALFNRPDVVRGVLRITRNSFFWGTGLFSIAHVVAAGHATALLAFGSVAVLALAGAPLLDAKKAASHGAAWESFAAVTSSLPFLAIAQGRQTLSWREIGLWRVALGTGVFLAVLLLHKRLFGGDPLAALQII